MQTAWCLSGARDFASAKTFVAYRGGVPQKTFPQRAFFIRMRKKVAGVNQVALANYLTYRAGKVEGHKSLRHAFDPKIPAVH